MKEEKVYVSRTEQQEQNAIEISSSLHKRLRLQQAKNLIGVRLGRNSTASGFVIIDGEGLQLKLPPEKAMELVLPEEELALSILSISENQVVLGPVLAVLTEVRITDDQAAFGSIHDFCHELEAYCRKKGCFFYVLSSAGLTFGSGPLSGYVLKENQWIKSAVPLPDVIYNRMHSRQKELKKLSSLTASSIPFFNRRFLNKWEVHERLWEIPHLRPYLPATEQLTTRTGLEAFLREHKDVFIKPVFGSQGKRIFRVSEKEQLYHLKYTTYSDEFKQSYHGFSELLQALYPRLRKEPFILQKTISIASFQSRPLDFRVLCHKGEDHGWKATSVIARVSGENQFVANLAQGGRLYPPGEVLEQLYGTKKGAQFKKLLKEISIEICEHLDLAAEGFYGEFGIDLAIDDSERLFMIEANVKPSKNGEYLPGITAVRPSAKAIVHYCLALSRLNEE
ncbi:YheC/YheD family protein [Metabacillus sp. GX 13764]|uniref:YheC/YheD family endospore coat-associated protein n=1 Tax=Metabacillus kandeliae TaxID=2900151 RepID=UPI001E389403|nr:YheC/YheD family protein [Metabacillus kandeliae]MCD7034835.1 YheC/YheD family protein [Metabacillus kandeliae]